MSIMGDNSILCKLSYFYNGR